MLETLEFDITLSLTRTSRDQAGTRYDFFVAKLRVALINLKFEQVISALKNILPQKAQSILNPPEMTGAKTVKEV
jgi:hypothetical protein